MNANLGFYIQKINDIVKVTEEVGETMNPYFEQVRQAIDKDEVSALTTEDLTVVRENFEKGTAKYQSMSDDIKKLKAPAKVMGIHKKLEKGYQTYVEGCEEMVNSISLADKQVDVALFNKAEVKQDETTDTISFCIQRMTSLLMK